MIEIAKQAALEAGKIVLSLRNKAHKVFEKGSIGDFATEADHASEQQIIKILKSNFPEHKILGEETGGEKVDFQNTWVIDPIDGTINYFHGLPTFGISIGLLKDNHPYLGVINLPALDSLLWAERGKGAYLNGKRIRVSNNKELSKALIGFDVWYAGGRTEELEKNVKPLLEKVHYMPSLASAAVALSYVSLGMFDGYIHTAFQWDYVAGAIIIQESGGKVTDYSGKMIDWSKEKIELLCSNSYLHDEIVSLIRR